MRADASEPFSEKLALALKALAVSRGRLAAELRVDKSVVSRWMSGATLPSAENLAQLTRFVAARQPGFTGLDWDRDTRQLALLFGGSGPAPVPAPALRPAGSWAPIATGFDGFWRQWRIATDDRDFAVCDCIGLRFDGENYALTVSSPPFQGSGRWVAGISRIYMDVEVAYDDVRAFGVFYSCPGRAQVLEGIVLSVAGAASRPIFAAPVIWDRFADLTSDPADDLRVLDAMVAAHPRRLRQDLPPGYLARLEGTSSDEGLFRLPPEPSLTRASKPAEREEAAARTASFLASGSFGEP